MAGGELQGWYQDPFGLHEKRYISAGRPTKLVRDGQVDSYDEPPSSTYEMPAGATGEQDFARGAATTARGNTVLAPEQAQDLRLPGPAEWSLWRSCGRAIMAVVVVATAAILAVIAFGGNDRPAWARSLGTGVAVNRPGPASPGHGSPGAAVYGFLAAIEAKNWAALCEYAAPAGHAPCTHLPAWRTAARPYFPDLKNIALGYTATDGNTALVDTTGTVCPAFTSSSKCYTNEDPAAILSSGKPFSTLWTEAISTSGNTYWLIPCVMAGGSWYIYIPPG
ncbi:MAG: hypothetical protein JO345_12970 [Streptosporangiaceae bacterium]|nr:hypothetical protein [Streptosporangiaceae bacterium]